jgi:hypothetical protein
MWVCPRCRADNQDHARLCWICGTAADGTAYETLVALPPTQIPPETTRHPGIGWPSKYSLAPPVGFTRRFSVGTLMIVMAFFAVLFAIMTTLDIRPTVFCSIAVFVAGTAVAQVVLFGGRKPRLASFVAGIPLGFVCGLVGMIIFSSSYKPSSVVTGLTLGDPVREPPTVYDVIVAAIACALCGGPCGYLAGCVVAGIFLVRERKADKETESQGTFDDDPEDQKANN